MQKSMAWRRKILECINRTSTGVEKKCKGKWWWIFATVVVVCLTFIYFFSCVPKKVTVQEMTLEEKVAQLFIVTPEVFGDVESVLSIDDIDRGVYKSYPVGGVILFRRNLTSAEQLRELNHKLQNLSIKTTGLPLFISVDEEGGTVARVGNHENFEVPDISDMIEIGSTEDVEKAYDAGASIGTYLSDLGFNIDFAPVADVLSNPDNTVVQLRSFGTDPVLVASMTLRFLDGLNAHGVKGVVKHFPGHGSTAADTHDGYAYTEKTLNEMFDSDLLPFRVAIDNDVNIVMVGHFAAPNLTGNDIPCSLSYEIITKLLREELGYQNLIVTDALNMGAITQSMTSAEAAVQAFKAGADLILMPDNFKEAYEGILKAVHTGEISEARIDESVSRILKLKDEMRDSGTF